jgi:hypothetical protein
MGKLKCLSVIHGDVSQFYLGDVNQFHLRALSVPCRGMVEALCYKLEGRGFDS